MIPGVVQSPGGSRVIVGPGGEGFRCNTDGTYAEEMTPLEGWRGEVTSIDGDDRSVRFDIEGEPSQTYYLDTWVLFDDVDCTVVPVHGEQWCDTHDTATPCVISELRQRD